jgi:hypothetical protein
MKSVPNFELGFSLSWQNLVAPGHDILLGLMFPFLMDQVDALIILVVKSSW